MQFALVSHRLSTETSATASFSLSAIYTECDILPEFNAHNSMHIPKGYAMKAMNIDTQELEEYKGLQLSSKGMLWIKSCSEEFHRLCTGTSQTPGSNTMFFIPHTDVPSDRKVTYMRLVITNRPQKSNPR
jgi:hypothetical protein